MGNHFVFLNISNAPSLGAPEAKRMRAHVTKTNFAQRRKRIAKRMQQDAPICENPPISRNHLTHAHGGSPTQRQMPTLPMQPAVLIGVPGPMAPTDSEFCIRVLIREMRAFVFPAGLGSTNGLTETLWTTLFLSEPALLDASMGVKLEHYEINKSSETSQRAVYHTLNAIRLINSKISPTNTGLSDGMLGAVFTLAIGERLANNPSGWAMHIEGLSRMVKLRRSQGNETIPQWFSEVVLHDSMTDIMSSPQAHNRHTKLVEALEGNRSRIMAQITKIWAKTVEIQQCINRLHHETEEDRALRERLIGSEIDELHKQLDFLGESDEPYIRAFVYSVELLLYLSWPHGLRTHPDILAEQLREALGQPHARPCSSIELKIWQLFVGAVAAQTGSITTERFIISLEGMLQSVRTCAWEDVCLILSKVYVPNPHLLSRFKSIWDQLKFPS